MGPFDGPDMSAPPGNAGSGSGPFDDPGTVEPQGSGGPFSGSDGTAPSASAGHGFMDPHPAPDDSEAWTNLSDADYARFKAGLPPGGDTPGNAGTTLKMIHRQEEISFDIVIDSEKDKDVLEGCYKIGENGWRIFYFTRWWQDGPSDIVDAVWGSGVSGVNVNHPKEAVKTIYRMEGDFDLMWVNCVVGKDTVLLDNAVHDGIAIEKGRAISLEWSSRLKGKDRLPVDCPNYPAYGTVMLSEKAVSALTSFLIPSGYFVDADLEGDISYKLFICRKEIDALDLARSEATYYDDGHVREVTRHELNEAIHSAGDIFRLRHRRAQIFVSNSFVDAVIENNLTGFVFTEVWNSQAGGTTLPPLTLPLEQNPGDFARRAAAKRAALRKQFGSATS